MASSCSSINVMKGEIPELSDSWGNDLNASGPNNEQCKPELHLAHTNNMGARLHGSLSRPHGHWLEGAHL